MPYKELVSGWEFTKTEFGIQGTRQFVESPAIPEVGLFPPVFGEDFFANSHTTADVELGIADVNKRIICRSIDKTPYGGMPDAFLYLFSYSNEDTDWTFFKTELDKNLENMSYSFDMGGDFQCLTPASDALAYNTDWYFASSGTEIRNESVPFKVTTATLKVSRYVPDDKFNAFQAKSLAYLGKINGIKVISPGDDNSSTWDSVKDLNKESNLFANLVGCWLYNGYTSEPHYTLTSGSIDEKYQTYHKVEMTFLLRAPGDVLDKDRLSSNGWLVILKNNGEWTEPSDGNNKIYEDCGSYTFAKLFE